MKTKILLIFSVILIPLFSHAFACNVACSNESLKIIENESILNKVTGLNFTSKKIAQTVIQKEIKDELNSKVKAQLEIYTIKRLKNGEFKSLTLTGKNIKYKAFSMSDFYAQTICPYNKVIYKKSRLYYPENLPFKYKGNITNEDIEYVLNSQDFKKAVEKLPLKINGVKILEIQTPSVSIKNNRLYFEVPLKTIFGKTTIKFNADAEAENNKIVLKNINLNSKNNIINNDIFSALTEKINPISYEINSINGKYCKFFITKAKISDNIISTEGIFIINKNYTENNE